MKKLILFASSLMLLAGCSAGPQVSTVGSGATLVLTSEALSDGYLGQAVAGGPYTVDHINRLVVTLYTLADGVETPVLEGAAPATRELHRGSLGDPVIFSRLKPHTTYRAKTEAWGGDIHYAALASNPEKLISTDDAQSYTDIVVTDDDRPTMGKLKVRLKARPFSGVSDFNVNIGKGGLVPGASESLVLENPPS